MSFNTTFAVKNIQNVYQDRVLAIHCWEMVTKFRCDDFHFDFLI